MMSATSSRISTSFRSMKRRRVTNSGRARAESKPTGAAKFSSRWLVYLIASSQIPRTYVGVTTDFPRRLKQHNGELKGGAKASRAGRPWVCACIVRGFENRSKACEFEFKWKSFSRKLPRKPKDGHSEDQGSLALLKHREAALDRVKCLLDCSHLQIEWHGI
ncbi:hypothetical protein QJS10_CPA16g01031 [Acorus calamus]|uniref:GIY-YIG domain-containing protein n=1 Tax=Acorus calamus TaxID=4465 RepID=A0AAV9D1B4_ACOCL|nr:hypothetical protein QJS10_CPA16g01031 [Acorus calamus]